MVQDAVEICQFLRRCPIFHDVEIDNLAEIAESMTLESITEGSRIIRQGEGGDKFFLLFEGSVDVVRDDLRVASLARGDVFGEAALVTGEPRNATVVCSSPVKVFSLSKAEFQSTMDKSRTFRDQVLRFLFQRQ